MKTGKTVSCILALGMAFSLAGCSIPFMDGSVSCRTYTGFFAASEKEISDDNTIQKLIAKKIGAKCDQTWLNEGDNADDIIENMIMSGEYPDFIYAGDRHRKLLEAGAYLPVDKYFDKYPNIKNYFSEEKWERLREDDGHIYIIPVFSSVYMHDTNTMHDDEAFWIQVRVLKWAGYPVIETVDEYFDLIEAYIQAHPEEDNIGYEILTDGYLYFCLENPPQFLDGYPNDGCCMVDRENAEVIDYNTTDTAKRWFKKLNEEYKKGIVDPDCFVLNLNQYYEKLASGNVLGMVDQRWNFKNCVDDLPDECAYVPLGLTIDKGITEHYHSEVAFDLSQGLGVTVSCKDPEGAFRFINDLLSPEILTLRLWGIENKDYNVDENGIFYITDEQRGFLEDKDYLYKERCEYMYFPYYKGMNPDGINACSAQYQPAEFYRHLTPIMQECFSAYGVRTYVELLNESEESAPWYPMWSFANTFSPSSPEGKAKDAINKVKHEYLPKVVMGDSFEKEWNDYMNEYKRCNVEAYISALQKEVDRCLR